MPTSNGASRMLVTASLSLAIASTARPAFAQQDEHSAHDGHAQADSMPGMQMPAAHSVESATETSMTSMAAMATNPHMKMTAPRRATAADSARARALADTLRRALAKYQDVKVAEADGFRMFAPQLKKQRVYHFTRNMSAVKAAFTFDAASPTSLLYTRDTTGRFTLVGAMYTAPRRLSEDDLNARVPLSIARWHEHVNICLPKRGATERWKETRKGQMLFGPAGAIATKQDCDTNDGRWMEHLFGWMVHANVFASNDPGTVWGDHH